MNRYAFLYPLLAGICAVSLCIAAADGSWLREVPDADRQRVNPYAAQADAIAAGGRVFSDHCAKCHGDDAMGRRKKPSLRSDRVQKATDGSQHAGNCAACHVAPDFTDFQFYNNGAAQEEYDAANGAGAFALLAIPNLAERTANFDAYLPVSANHPNASERFRHAAVAGSPQFADLGLWNVYLNPDIPNPQADLSTLICANVQNCTVDQGLPTTIAKFKTPTLRDGEDSQPYFHNGSKAKFNDVVEFYIRSSQLAHQGALRNAPLEFNGMSISEDDVNALVAFLMSLTEDYDDA
jgi:cytochrome c peroxidase